MKITALYRYPVKSMGGESLQSADLDEWGLLGDRVWAVKDQGRSTIQGAKKSASLLQCSARFAEAPSPARRSAPVVLSLPDYRELRSDDPGVGAALTATLGLPVELSPIIDPAREEPFRREAPPAGTDMVAYLRGMFARTEEEPLPDLSGFPPEVMAYEAPPGTWFDAYPVLLMTTQTFAALGAARPESRFDVRRFRPNLVIDAGGNGFVENGWIGKTLRVGEVRLAIEMACPRCIMTTHPLDDLPKDPKIMRTLVQQNGGNAGVYARVVTPGVVHAGDTCVIES